MLEALYASVVILFFGWYFDKKRWDKEGMNYHPFSDTSYPNPTNQVSRCQMLEERIEVPQQLDNQPDQMVPSKKMEFRACDEKH